MNVGEILSSLLSVGIKAVIAIFALLLAFRIITVILRKLEERLRRRTGLDKTVLSTAFYAVSALLKALVVLSLIAYLGVDVSGITALIASLGVGVGLGEVDAHQQRADETGMGGDAHAVHLLYGDACLLQRALSQI